MNFHAVTELLPLHILTRYRKGLILKHGKCGSTDSFVKVGVPPMIYETVYTKKAFSEKEYLRLISYYSYGVHTEISQVSYIL